MTDEERFLLDRISEELRNLGITCRSFRIEQQHVGGPDEITAYFEPQDAKRLARHIEKIAGAEKSIQSDPADTDELSIAANAAGHLSKLMSTYGITPTACTQVRPGGGDRAVAFGLRPEDWRTFTRWLTIASAPRLTAPAASAAP